MARIWQSGAELQSATALMEVDTASGSPTIETTTKRSGNAAWRFNATGTAKYIEHRFATVDTDTFISCWVYFNSFPGSTTPILQMRDSGGLGPLIRITSGGALQFIDGAGAQQGSNTAALSTGTWYNIQIRSNDTPAAQEGRLNGATIGNTATGYSGQYIRVGVQGSVTCDMIVDDIMVNDDSGTAQNSWPSITSKIVHALPNAAGDNNSWEKSGGGAGSSTNYQDVDETTPDDATSYLVRDTGASNQPKDLYNIQASSIIGIGASDTINCVLVGGRIGSTSATSAAGRNINFGIKAGGTESWSGSVDASINGYTTNADPQPRTYKFAAYVDPSDSAAWTPSKIDSLQIGVRANSAATTDVRFSAVWATIEFEAVASSAVKTVDGLARASVKTMKGLALASVKNVNGLA